METDEGASSKDKVQFVPRAFDPALVEERDAIMSHGFFSWKKRDYKDFVDACKSHGRAALSAICKDLGRKSGEQV